MFKCNIKLIEVSLQLLLVSESFILGSGFILKAGLHGLNGSLVSLSQAFKLLLLLQTLADFVNFMDGSASFSNLVHDVLDLIGQVLVLPPDLVQLGHGLLVGGLHLEQL